MEFRVLKNPRTPRTNYADGIWKGKFHSESALIVYRPHYAGGIKNVTITGQFRVGFERKPRTLKLYDYHDTGFRKASFLSCFPFIIRKRKAVVFKFLRFEEPFLKTLCFRV